MLISDAGIGELQTVPTHAKVYKESELKTFFFLSSQSFAQFLLHFPSLAG
jgi:hypothetical protein